MREISISKVFKFVTLLVENYYIVLYNKPKKAEHV